MNLEPNVPRETTRQVFDNPFPVMKIEESFAVPDEQYHVWQVRSRYWAHKVSMQRAMKVRFTWRRERNEDGTWKGTYRCWRVS